MAVFHMGGIIVHYDLICCLYWCGHDSWCNRHRLRLSSTVCLKCVAPTCIYMLRHGADCIGPKGYTNQPKKRALISAILIRRYPYQSIPKISEIQCYRHGCDQRGWCRAPTVTFHALVPKSGVLKTRVFCEFSPKRSDSCELVPSLVQKYHR